MKKSEIAIIKRAIALLHSLTDEPCAVDSVPRSCAVSVFARRYLVRDPKNSLTCQEISQFYAEVAASGEVEPLGKAEFLRRLPGVMQAVFGVRKSHAVECERRRVRGFKGVGIRLDTDTAGPSRS